jgi:hypothetical protein
VQAADVIMEVSGEHVAIDVELQVGFGFFLTLVFL